MNDTNVLSFFEAEKFEIPKSYQERKKLIEKLKLVENIDVKTSIQFKKLSIHSQENIHINLERSINCVKRQNGTNILSRIFYFVKNLIFKDFIDNTEKLKEKSGDIKTYIEQTRILIQHSQVESKLESVKQTRSIKYPHSEKDRQFKELKRKKHENLANKGYSLDLAKAVEIRNALQQDYYTFTHGQQAEWMIVAMLIKELVKLENHALSQKHGQQYLRHPKNIDHSRIKNDILHDHAYSNELLSVDSDLSNTAEGESAIYFLNHQNILTQTSNTPVNQKLIDVLKKYISKPIAHQFILKKVTKIIQEMDQRHNLVIISIPKNKINEIGYLSMPYGSPLKSENVEGPVDISSILDRQQAGEHISVNLKQEINFKKAITPQFRLFTSKLNSEGVYSCFSRSLYEEDYRQTKEKIKALALDIWHIHLCERAYQEINLKIEEIDVFQYEKAVDLF